MSLSLSLRLLSFSLLVIHISCMQLIMKSMDPYCVFVNFTGYEEVRINYVVSGQSADPIIATVSDLINTTGLR
jgi:hypothetical protein